MVNIAIPEMNIRFRPKGSPREPLINNSAAKDSKPKAENRRLGLIFGWAAGFCLAIYLLGFHIAIPFFAFAYLKWRGRSWLTAAVFAVALLAFTYAVFDVSLKSPLYRGLIFGGR